MAKIKILYFYILFFFYSIFSYSQNNSITSVDAICVKEKALSEVGITENGKNNRGERIKEYLNNVGLSEGYAWCAAFVAWVLDNCGIKNSVNAMSTSAFIKSDVIYTDGKFKKSFSNTNDIMLMTLSYDKFKNTNRYKAIGHTGIVIKLYDTYVNTVEGNTNEAGARDSRAGSDGVYKKIRRLNKNIHITRIKY